MKPADAIWRVMAIREGVDDMNSTEQAMKKAIRNCIGALDACMTQISQMQGMFDDIDGAIQEAMEAAEEAMSEAAEALAS